MQEEPNNVLQQEQETSSDSLKELMNLCRKYEELLEEKEQVDERAKNLAEQIENIGRFLIPDLMGEIGIESLSLSSGKKVSLREAYLPSVPAEELEAYYDWMEENNHESIMKKEFRIPEQFVEEVEEFLKQRYPDRPDVIEKIRKINHMTWRSWTKEMVLKELPLPESLNVYHRKEVVIK